MASCVIHCHLHLYGYFPKAQNREGKFVKKLDFFIKQYFKFKYDQQKYSTKHSGGAVNKINVIIIFRANNIIVSILSNIQIVVALAGIMTTSNTDSPNFDLRLVKKITTLTNPNSLP